LTRLERTRASCVACAATIRCVGGVLSPACRARAATRPAIDSRRVDKQGAYVSSWCFEEELLAVHLDYTAWPVMGEPTTRRARRETCGRAAGATSGVGASCGALDRTRRRRTRCGACDSPETVPCRHAGMLCQWKPYARVGPATMDPRPVRREGAGRERDCRADTERRWIALGDGARRTGGRARRTMRHHRL
jgi:hypothetical protein